MNKELAQWIELHRIYGEYRYSTKELAEYLGVSTRTIQRWVKGQYEPNQKNIILIRKYLKEKAQRSP
ncbi:MAG: helix-turn-helix transcriptional regulator [PVC group bacterium]|nr:helix-turn-helix transcriptional regulator [PVC group bacterium]